MFDKEKTGYVEVVDLQTILRSLGRDPNEATELLEGLGISQEGKLSFEEFLKIMKNLENRLIANKAGVDDG
jgi:Ca2+-binding EF-hand superfamily protein